jgi:hypothetical protein
VAKKKKTQAGVDKNLDILCHLAREMQTQGPSDFPGPKDDSVTAFVMTQSMSSLSGDFDDAFRGIVDGLSLVEHIKSRYTRAAVSSLCWSFLFREGDRVIDPESREAGDHFASRVKAARVSLRKTLCDVPMTSWKVFLGIEGFGELDGSGWDFGGVKFLPSKEANLLLAQELDSATKPNQRDSNESIKIENSILEDQEKSFGKRTVGIVTVDACENKAAQHLAERKLQTVLDCINFLASLVGSRGMYAVVLQGVGLRSYSHIPVVGPGGSGSISTHLGPRNIMADLHPDILTEKLDSELIDTVDKLAQNAGPNEIEERILRAIQWEGRAGVEHRPEEAFLWHAISLEVLLLGQNSKGELNYRLSLYIAHLLSSDPHLREVARNDIKRFYNARSQIVHNGHYEIADIEEQKLGRYARKCIIQILWDHFKGNLFADKSLDDWLSDKLLGFPDENAE